jgi:hypothetical protein
MLSLRSSVARPVGAQRRAAAACRPARAVVVRADKADALKELQQFQEAAKAKMLASLDEAQTSAAAPIVMAAQVRGGCTRCARMSCPPGPAAAARAARGRGAPPAVLKTR